MQQKIGCTIIAKIVLEKIWTSTRNSGWKCYKTLHFKRVNANFVHAILQLMIGTCLILITLIPIKNCTSVKLVQFGLRYISKSLNLESNQISNCCALNATEIKQPKNLKEVDQFTKRFMVNQNHQKLLTLVGTYSIQSQHLKPMTMYRGRGLRFEEKVTGL